LLFDLDLTFIAPVADSLMEAAAETVGVGEQAPSHEPVAEPKASQDENKEKDTLPTPSVPKVKRDFYQTGPDVVVNILAKNLQKEEVEIEILSDTLTVNAKLPDGTVYHETIKLYQPINPSACSFKVLSTKIEIRLRKLEASHWPALEAAKKPEELKPCYPTSSKNKKDWGKVEKQLEQENPEDEDVNSLFAKIFASGDENTRRAMMKSMQESGGTVLSTNWDEVGKKKVECTPPDGMEWKKWDSATSDEK